jgi:hypothetical protein
MELPWDDAKRRVRSLANLPPPPPNQNRRKQQADGAPAYCGSTHARKIEEHSNKEKDDQQCRAYAAPDRDSLHVDLDVLAHRGPPQ